MGKPDALIEKLAMTIDRPIIVMDPGWSTPEWLRGMIALQRLAASISGEEMATEAEALAYVSNASFQAPLSHDWTEIYSYLFTMVDRERLPDELRKESISQYQEGMLRDLRRWLFKTSVKHYKERRKRDAGESEHDKAYRGAQDSPGSSPEALGIADSAHGSAVGG